MKKLIVGLCCAVLPSVASAQHAANHLVISEVGYDTVDESSGSAEFIEIHNPTDAAITLNAGAVPGVSNSLASYFLSDHPDYWKITDPTVATSANGNRVLLTGTGNTSDWIFQFPVGTTIPARGIVVVTESSDAFLAEFYSWAGATHAERLAKFNGMPGNPILMEVNQDGNADNVPDMIVRATYASSVTPILNLTNGGENVVLYRWDGASDLVEDVDIAVWVSNLADGGMGTPTQVPNKTGVNVDGPDNDAITSSYATETLGNAAPQAPANSGSLQRKNILEPSEPDTGGNGTSGHGELGESWSTTTTWVNEVWTPGWPLVRVDGTINDAISFYPAVGVSSADGPNGAANPQDFAADGTLTELYVRAIDSDLRPDAGTPGVADAIYIGVRGSMFGEPEVLNTNATLVFVDLNPTGVGGVKRMIASGNQLSDTTGALDSRITNSGFQLPTTYPGDGFDLALGTDTVSTTNNLNSGVRSWGTGPAGVTGTSADFAYLGTTADLVYDSNVSALLPGKPGTSYAARDGIEAVIKIADIGGVMPEYIFVVAGTTTDTGAAPSPNTVPESSSDSFTAPHTMDNGACVEVASGRVVTRYVDLDGDGVGGSTPACGPLGTNIAATTGDCDDNDSARAPGKAEVCDSKDNDCDGAVDNGLTFSTYYPDTDNDTYGVSAGSISSCQPAAPPGYANRAGDCNDTMSGINPGAQEVCDASNVDEDCDGVADDLDQSTTGKTTYYRDQDNDTYGTPATTQMTCEAAPTGYVANNTDCNDNDQEVHPGKAEICDSIDNNCSGVVDEGVSTAYYRDADNDTYGDPNTSQNACAPPSGFVTSNTDCNDTNANIKPGQTEVCNGIDDDCDMLTDEGLTLTSWYPDNDSDTYGAGTAVQACSAPPNHVANNMDCNDSSNAIHPAATEVPGDSVDQNCDGAEACYVDADSDGFRAPGAATIVSADTDCNDMGEGTTAEPATDCADNNAAVNPGAAEIPADGMDQNCDTMELCFADADNDGYRPNATATVVSTDLDCADANEAVGSDPTTDCDDTVASVNPAGTETCNGADDNCNGTIDEGVTTTFYVDADGDGVGGTTTQAACAQPTGYVTTGGDCDDSDLNVKPNAAETCDAKDNDCDGTVDEGVKTTFYVDADGDGAGGSGTQQACVAPTGYVATQNDCDDADAEKKPAGTEVCDGKDNNCNGVADEGVQTTFYVDADGDGQGGQSSVSACTAPTGHSANSDDCNDGDASVKKASKEEACTDAVDNDCDGKIDSDDADDCQAAPIDPEPACGCSSGTEAAFAPLLLVGLALLRRRRS